MAFDVQTLTDAARCAECLSPNQKQNVLLYLLNGILENGSGGGGLHNLLSLTHPDTVPGPPFRGSLIVGNATPDWEVLLIGANGTFLGSNGTDASWIALPGSFTGFANPTASVGLVAVNGVATTAMRSDAAPPIDVTISPTWSGTHTFTASATIIGSAANALNVIQIVPPAALGANMVDLFSDGGPGYNSIRKYFSSPFQVEIASSGGIDFVIDSNNNETGQSVKFLTNALRGGAQTTLFTFLDSGVLVFSPVVAGAIQFNPFGAAAGNTSEMRYLELLANGTNYTGFKAPDALAASEIYVFPDAAPAANRFLRAAAVAGGVSALSWAQVSLTADVTGTLPVGNGGTGLTTGTSGGILGFTAATTIASSVLLTANALILGGGAGATPVPMASLGTTTTVLHGNAAGAPTFGAVVLTTDVSGILPVANGGSGTSTAFTLGSVIFAGAAGVYTEDNANFFFDNTNNRLGIGNATPTAILTVGADLGVAGNIASYKPIAANSGTSNRNLYLNLGTSSAQTGTTYGIQNVVAATNATGNVAALIGSAYEASKSGAGTITTLTGFSANANNAGTGAIFTLRGADSTVQSTVAAAITQAIGMQVATSFTAGTITNNFGVRVMALSLGGGTVTNNYGLYIETQVGGGTLNYALYSAGGQSYFAGAVGIGVTIPLSKLHVTNTDAATVAEIIKAAAAQSANLMEWQNSSATILTKVNEVGNVGVRMAATALTAYLHIAAGTTAASTAPIKLTTGTSMTAAEAGAVEFTTDDLFFTITTGVARKRLLMADATAGLTSGKMPIATTNGRLIDLTASSAYTPTNVTTDRAYDANATTLDEIADTLGTVISDLQAKGILG